MKKDVNKENILPKPKVKIRRYKCTDCESKNLFMQNVATEYGSIVYLICGDCGKKIKSLEEDEIPLVERFLSVEAVDMPDTIQCPSCRELAPLNCWIAPIDDYPNIRFCQRCGALRFIYNGNKSFRFDEDREVISSGNSIRDELGRLTKV